MFSDLDFDYFFFFFFQAEDGIRDHCVTGVQTCALPICELRRRLPAVDRDVAVPDVDRDDEPLAELARCSSDECGGEIGRASCRERGEIAVVAGSLKKKRETMNESNLLAINRDVISRSQT